MTWRRMTEGEGEGEGYERNSAKMVAKADRILRGEDQVRSGGSVSFCDTTSFAAHLKPDLDPDPDLETRNSTRF